MHDSSSSETSRWFRLNRGLRVTLVILALVVLWEIICRVFKVRAFLLPPPSLILLAMEDQANWLLLNTWNTFYETVFGFISAVILGVILSILIISSRFVEETVYVVLVALNGIPKVALAPLFVVWMGTGIDPKIAIAATLAVFVIVVDLVLGFRSVDPEMIDLARSLKGSKWKMLIKIRFPSALPNLFAGMKIGTTLALIGAIVGEFVTANKGLGYVILNAQSSFDIPLMFAAVLLLSLMGTVLFFLVDVLEQTTIPWHVSRRKKQLPPRR